MKIGAALGVEHVEHEGGPVVDGLRFDAEEFPATLADEGEMERFVRVEDELVDHAGRVGGHAAQAALAAAQGFLDPVAFGGFLGGEPPGGVQFEGIDGGGGEVEQRGAFRRGKLARLRVDDAKRAERRAVAIRRGAPA